jgi:hypothetical protein
MSLLNWKRFRKARDTTEEACRELNKLEDTDERIMNLGIELAELQRRNNFSGMVENAFRGVRDRG